jgi:flagellar biosynthesis protein FliQ
MQTALTQALLLFVTAAAPPLLSAALCALLLSLFFGRSSASAVAVSRGPLLTLPCLAAGLLGLVLAGPMIGQAFSRFLTSILLALPQLRAG